MNEFLARFNIVIEDELLALEKLSSEASARTNANKCRMIKANIAFSTDPGTQACKTAEGTQACKTAEGTQACKTAEGTQACKTAEGTPFVTMTPEEQKYRTSLLDQAQVMGRVTTFRTAVDNYMNYIKKPKNDNIRRFIDEDLSSLDSVEKFIHLVNRAHLDYLFDNHEFPCPCDANSETFETILYANLPRNNHTVVPCKSKCSFGTKMAMSDVSVLLKRFDFIDYGSEFSITFSEVS